MLQDNKLIESDVWYKSIKEFTPAGVFEALIRHDANVGYNTIRIWGDKSPSYIRYIPILKKNFPKARFIHILRDVRDYCLSINKAWGKNMLRAAQRWSDDIKKARVDGSKLKTDYIEIKYEDLITEPDLILNQICNFLNIEYDQHMKILLNPTENLGDAKGIKQILSNNKNKYTRLMGKNTQLKIEAITASTLKSCGYFVDYFGEAKKISKRQLFFYRLIDGLNLIRFSIKDKGHIATFNENIFRFFS